ncbi:MAG: hypothetical protein J5858_05815 [Lentisphaeria bacterium]|nr:hypothetical protein [Lentisphaeria bacterium]
MLKLGWVLFLYLCVWLVGGCAADPWRDVPEFEVFSFICPVPDGKFLEDANFITGWSVLGPLNPGEKPSIHKEYVKDEALLTGNRRAPRGARWYRISVRRSGGSEILPGEIDFSSKFQQHPEGMKKSVFYACATLKCDWNYRGMVLFSGSCGQQKIWLNGRSVYSCERGSAALKPEMAKVEDLELRKGFNRIVIKYLDDGKDYCSNRKFFLRFADEAGNLSVVR